MVIHAYEREKGTSVSGSDVSVHMQRQEQEEPAAVLPEAEEALVPEAAVITVRIPTVPAEVPVR